MEGDLISKKDLLAQTGISYGQLYRWKRKGLIPEDWFIRRSTYTGQETFFPRDKILERVARIMNMKEDVSLDDLAGVFSPQTADVRLSAAQVSERGIAPELITGLYAELFGGVDFGFDDMACMLVLSELLDSGGLSREEAALATRFLKTNLEKFGDGFCELFAVRKLGVFTCFAAKSPCELCFEDGLRVLAHLNLAAIYEKLKLKFM